MDVGAQLMLQNLGRGPGADQEVFAEELGLADLAVELGFDSLWGTEHHFSGYSMIPNVLTLLTYLAGRHPNVGIGSSVVVLPWHNPVRVAGEVALLDNLSGGRLILGIGRGLGRIEFEAFGVPMDESRPRFVEAAQLLLQALDNGYSEYDGQYFRTPRRELRPTPTRSFRGRAYAAAVSPESSQIMAELGVGLLVSPQKPWDVARVDIDRYRVAYREVNGSEPPAPLFQPKVFCDRDPARAEEMAYRYGRVYYHAVIKHYEMASDHFAKTKGYEFYAAAPDEYADGGDSAADEFVRLQLWGTPEQCFERVLEIQELVGIDSCIGLFSFGGMPPAIAEGSIRLFAAEVMPRLRALPAPEPAAAL